MSIDVESGRPLMNPSDTRGVDTPRAPFLAFMRGDAVRANEAWGCNCGPCALAACLGLTPDQVRPHLGDFETRRHMNPTAVLAALQALGGVVRPTGLKCPPAHGLVRVQWDGPWTGPGVPARVAYRFTHWVAAKNHGGSAWVYDANAPSGWVSRVEWEESVAPRIVAGIPRATGGWWPTHCWEVRRAKGGMIP